MTKARSNERTILYYPTIKITDGNWLRNAILYWDNVASIVPGYNYDEFNSPEVEYLSSVGIYKPIYPASLEGNDVLCNRFCCEVKAKLDQRRKRDGNEEISRIHREKLAMSQQSMLHINKTPELILDFLKEEGIVMENCDGPWLNMRTRDADIYMSILAKYLAKIEGNTDIGTDVYRRFFYPYVRANQRNEEKQIYLDMALQKILPIPDNTISYEEIVDFRMEYHTKLQSFRRRIDLLYDRLKSDVEEIEELQEKIIRFKNEIDDDLHMIEELLNKDSIPFKLCSLRTLLPMAATVGIEIATWKKCMSKPQEILAEVMLNLVTLVVRGKNTNDYQINENNAYLFYAMQNGMIK